MMQITSPRFRRSWPAAVMILTVVLCGRAADTLRTPLEELLARTGKQVAGFVSQFSEVTCTELVSQEKFHTNGKLEAREESAFDLLTMLDFSAGEAALNESRLPQPQTQRRRPNASKASLLVTNGFSTLLLIFHPYYQSNFEFSPLSDELAGGKRWLRVRFRHIKGTPSPTALILRGRTYALDLQGVAWIDPDSGMISRMDTELESDLQDLGLRVFNSNVQYAPVKLAGADVWLPVAATIDVQTLRQHWRNVHQFTNYRRFSVSTESRVPEP